VFDGLRGETPIAKLCRREGIHSCRPSENSTAGCFEMKQVCETPESSVCLRQTTNSVNDLRQALITVVD
jgi:hypothetical protein